MASLPSDGAAAWFRRQVERGLEAEQAVARKLLAEGLWVWHPVPRFIEGFAPGEFPATYSDVITQNDQRVKANLEIRAKACAFSGPEDFPFPTAYLDKSRRWATRTDDPMFFVLYSEPTEGIMVVPCYTSSDWQEVVADFGPVLVAPRHCFRSWEWFIDQLRRM
jgi:hypothetical protein